jgi:hypothetical protein
MLQMAETIFEDLCIPCDQCVTQRYDSHQANSLRVKGMK